jgi:hypothetical protein
MPPICFWISSVSYIFFPSGFAIRYSFICLGIQDQGESIAAMAEKAHFGQNNMGNFTAMTPGVVDVSKNSIIRRIYFHG